MAQWVAHQQAIVLAHHHQNPNPFVSHDMVNYVNYILAIGPTYENEDPTKERHWYDLYIRILNYYISVKTNSNQALNSGLPPVTDTRPRFTIEPQAWRPEGVIQGYKIIDTIVMSHNDDYQLNQARPLLVHEAKSDKKVLRETLVRLRDSCQCVSSRCAIPSCYYLYWIQDAIFWSLSRGQAKAEFGKCNHSS